MNKYRTEKYEGTTNQENAYRKLIEIINIEKGSKVLDIGCGNGQLGKFLKNVKLIGGGFEWYG